MSRRIRKKGSVHFTNEDRKDISVSILKVVFTEHLFEEHHPYGSTTAIEELCEIEDEEYYVNDQSVSWSEVQELVGGEDIAENLLSEIIESAVEI